MRYAITTLTLLLGLTLTLSAQAQSSQRPTVEVAFVLDTTGSMGGLIEGAKQKIWSIASKIADAQPSPDLRVGLIGYRDKGDAYVTRVFDLNEDLDHIYQQLTAFRAQGGGDTPEHVGRALGEAVSTLSWSQNPKAMKMIFLVGDAPPQRYQDGWNATHWAKRAAERGLIVNTIRCGKNVAAGSAFQEIAQLAGGSFTSIAASGGMVAVHTPYDAKIERLNQALSETALYGGSGRKEAKRKASRIGAMKGEVAANRVKYQLAKNSSTGRSDVALAPSRAAQDLTARPEALETMASDELPAELKRMDKKAQKAHLKKLAKKRKALNKKLAKLSKERDAFIKKKASEKADSFDAQVMRDIKKQGKSFGLSF